MFQIDTVGLEIETTSRIPGEFFKDALIANNFRSTHDASVETPIKSLSERLYIEDMGNLPALFKGLYGGTAGVEFVSNPLPFDEMEPVITYLLRKLYRFGAREEEDRAGLHIHCAYPISTNILLNTLKLSLALESLLFHLGGLTYTFRGNVNESIFCRPLTSFGPPIVVDHSGNWIQLLDVEKVLSGTKDLKSFWELFGGIDMNNPPNRYHPVRYFCVNVFSAMLHSTLEFRIFNTTLTPEHVLACIKFCQEFTFLTAQKKCPFNFVSSVYNPTFSSEELLSKFAYETNLETKWYKILLDILERTPKPVLKPVFVKTHLRDYRPIMIPYPQRVFKEDEFVNSNFIDIHTINPTNNNRNNGAPIGLSERIQRDMLESSRRRRNIPESITENNPMETIISTASSASPEPGTSWNTTTWNTLTNIVERPTFRIRPNNEESEDPI